MRYLKFLFLLIVLIILNLEAMCQDKIEILPERKYRYKYKNRLLKAMQLERVLLTNQEAFKEYKKFKKTKQGASMFGSSSIILAIGMLVEASRGFNRSEEVVFESKYIGFYILGSLGTGITGLVLNSRAKKNRKKAIETFNNGIDSPPEIGKVPVELNLGFTSAGLGIRFSF